MMNARPFPAIPEPWLARATLNQRPIIWLKDLGPAATIQLAWRV